MLRRALAAALCAAALLAQPWAVARAASVTDLAGRSVEAVRVLATWLHPDLFAGLDPKAAMRGLYHRFQPVKLDGTFRVAAR